MTPEDYVYYFGYKRNGRYSDMVRSQFGSNNLANAVWTVPSLLLVGQYMHSKVGALTMAKFTPMCLFAVMAFHTAFGPNKENMLMPNIRLIGGMCPVSFECHKNGQYYMGADSLAQGIIYFALLYHRMWAVTGVCMAFDLAYYGPMTMGGPFAAVVGALTIL